MIDPSTIIKDMPVIGSDGETLGQVDGVEGGDHIKLKRTTSPDGQHHFVALADVARVDEHVHLTRTAADVRSGWVDAGAAAMGAAATGAAASGAATTETADAAGAREVHVDEEERNWLPWILGSLALLALLIFGLRSCGNQEPAVAPVVNGTTNNAATAPPAPTDVVVAVEQQSVVLPGGSTMMVTPRTIAFDLQRYLASTEATPRSFQFERLNFDTGKSDIRAIDRATVDGIGQVLVAYPAARIRLIGFADARGDADANASLGVMRARAVSTALVARGVAADRIDTASGGETGSDATNATTQGQAENRRTELVVLAK